MSNSDSPRVLGYGMWDHPEFGDTQEAGRLRFLDTIHKWASAVLCALFTTVLPAYGALTHDDNPDVWLDWAESEAAGRGTTLPALHSWAGQWCIAVDWVRMAALQTLRFWEISGRQSVSAGRVYPQEHAVYLGWHLGILVEHAETLRASRGRPAPIFPTFPEPVPFELEAPGYDEQPGEARVRLLKLAKEAIDAHLAEAEARAEVLGWRSKTEFREPDHWRWLVDFQVNKRNYSQVANKYHAHRSTVEDALDKLSTAIGLPLRRIPPGRPRQ